MNDIFESTNRLDNRKSVAIPEEVHANLLMIASELDFQHKGQVCVLGLLEAISELSPETVYDVLRDHGLLYKRRFPREETIPLPKLATATV